MSTITNYKCDKCGNIQHTAEQFWTVGVKARTIASQQQVYDSSFSLPPMEVCRKCLESLGLYPTKKTVEAEGYAPPTLEELIIEIVQREAGE